MRNLIDLLQTLNEAVGLSAGEIIKYEWRFAKFIEKIKGRSPFTTVTGDEVTIDPREAKRFEELYDRRAFVGALKARTTDGDEIPLSKLAKTGELGGAAVTAGLDSSTAGKEGLLVKPSNIGITDQDIPSSALHDTIASNSVLNSTDYGKVVVQLSNYIVAGEYVMIPEEYQKKDKKNVLKAIVDYAGEYLGVLALLYNRSRFPRKAEFEKWLGGSTDSLTINFPGKANNNLADSFATIKNSESGHTLNISSKGTGGGAAPAISGLKVPDHIRDDPTYEAACAFIDLCQTQGTIPQAFSAMDLIFHSNPKAINKKWHPFLPFATRSPDLESMAKQSIDAKKQRVDSPLQKQYQKLYSDIDSKGDASSGGKLVYAIKKEVVNSINEHNGIPEFDAAVLQILEMNFIQQYADYKGGEMTFATQWPAKLNGDIHVVNKSSAVDPTAGGFSFKLGRVEASDEPGVDGENLESEIASEPESEKDFMAGAEEIATGRATRNSLTPRQKLDKKKEQLQKRIDAFNKENPDFNTEPVTGVGRSMRKR